MGPNPGKEGQMTTRLIHAMTAAIDDMKKWPAKTVQLFHHNDADGLSSGAILKTAFERRGYSVRRFSLEKPYPEVLKKVFSGEGNLIVLTDFAGRIAPLISDLNQGRNLTLILDHHKAFPATDPRVHNLDPELFGLKGDRDITASATCYLFARTMDEGNRDLAYVAAIGAVGDQFYVDGRLVTVNREVVLETVNQGRMEIREHEQGEDYYFKTNRGWLPGDALWTYLDTLGGTGFYQNGTAMGVQVCLNGFSKESDKMLARLQTLQRSAYQNQVRRIKSGEIKQGKNIQWIHVQDRFAPMGVKMIGALLDETRNSGIFHAHKYIAGFMIIPNEVPGFGPIQLNQAKISMRAADPLEDRIRSGTAPGMDTFLPEATDRMGGFSDACHSLTAATTMAIGREAQLIDEMEKILADTL